MLDLQSLHTSSAPGGFVHPRVNNAVLWPAFVAACLLEKYSIRRSVATFLALWSILHHLALSRPKVLKTFSEIPRLLKQLPATCNYLPHAIMALYCFLGSLVTRKGRPYLVCARCSLSARSECKRQSKIMEIQHSDYDSTHSKSIHTKLVERLCTCSGVMIPEE